MATKKAAKKAVAAPVAKRAYNRKPKEVVFYVLSERTKLFSWKPKQLYPDYQAASTAKADFEKASPLSIQGYKIDKVVLVK